MKPMTTGSRSAACQRERTSLPISEHSRLRMIRDVVAGLLIGAANRLNTAHQRPAASKRARRDCNIGVGRATGN
ncbi:hypothetical protein LR961_02660 [Stenotrophomonas sp. SY1]|nr:hypothetical protein [Stenotrophomonas sp. SY1]